MTPFHFGMRERRLFGVYDPAHKSSRLFRAAVLCHPLGDEQVHAYRTMRQLARSMAQAGLDVLRFDYYGTGDSSGETDAVHFAGLCEDIETAIEEIKDMTGTAKVTLVGLRIGANLAAQVAVRRSDEIDNLVLWEPLLDHELHPAIAAAASQLEQPGFHQAPILAGEIAHAKVESIIEKLPPHTLVVLMGRANRAEDLGALHVEHLTDVKPWIEERTTTGTIPADVLRRIVSWLQ